MVPSARWLLRHGVASVTGFAREFGGDAGGAVLISRRANRALPLIRKPVHVNLYGPSRAAHQSSEYKRIGALVFACEAWVGPYPQVSPTGSLCQQAPPTNG